MCMLLSILLMSRDADTARCKVVWTCVVGYTAVSHDILLCSYKCVRSFIFSGLLFC